MPTHNTDADWLTDAVQSVLADTGCNLELIVVDDRSEVPASEVLAKITDQRLRIIKAHGAGQSHARNEGIEAATGTWIRHFDSDDIAAPGSTSYLLALAGGNPNVVTYGSFIECDMHLSPVRTISSNWSGWIAERLMKDPAYDIYHWCMLIPRDVLVRIGGWDVDITHSVDWDLVLRVADEVPFLGGDQIVAHYRRHGGSVSADGAFDGLDGIRSAHQKAFKRHPEWVGTHVEASARLQLLSEEIAWGDWTTSLPAASRSLGRAIVTDPGSTLRYCSLTIPSLAKVAVGRALRRLR